MAVVYYHSNVLPWTALPEENNRLKKIISFVFIFFIATSLVIPLIPVPEVDRSKQQEIPPRLAKLILEKKKPKPKPVVEIPKKEEKKVEKKEEKKKVKKKEKKKEVKKKPEKPKVDLAKQRARAREKAASSGLLAMMDDMADLRDEPVINKNIKLSKAATRAKKSTSPELVTSNIAGSGGLSSSALKRATTQSRTLGSRSGTEVDSPVEASAAEAMADATAAERGSPRPLDEIQRVFDKHKGAIIRIYNRALRKDPTLRGVVVLEITISPAGKVVAIKAVSSDIDSPSLVKKLLARVKSFKFKAKNVDEVTIRYPVDFSPAS